MVPPCVTAWFSFFHLTVFALNLFSVVSTEPDISIDGLTNTVLEGSAVVIVCRNPPDCKVLSWKFKEVGAERDVIIYSEEVGINRNITSFDSSKNERNSSVLFSNSVTLKDNGTYTCICGQDSENATKLIRIHTELIVLEHASKCNLENCSVARHVEIKCNVALKGNSRPLMEWRSNSPNGERIPNEVVPSESENSLTYLLTIDTDSLENLDAIYFCQSNTFLPDLTPSTCYRVMNESDWSQCLEDVHDRRKLSEIAVRFLSLAFGVMAATLVAALVIIFLCTRARGGNKGDKAEIQPPVTEHNSNRVNNQPLYDEPSPYACSRLDLPTSNSMQEPQTFFGADGTEYLEMDNMRHQDEAFQPPIKTGGKTKAHILKIGFSQSEYAKIDHTLQIPKVPEP